MSFLPEMEVSELEVLCGELGLEIPQEKKGVRRLSIDLFLNT